MKDETALVEEECGGTITVTRSSETGCRSVHARVDIDCSALHNAALNRVTFPVDQYRSERS